jgi:TolA-binding protein
MANVVSAKTKGRLTKKELKQDKLVELAYKAEAFYLSHKNLVLGIAAAIVVVVAGTWLVQTSMQSSRDQENYDLTLAKMLYGSGQLEESKSGFTKVLSTASGDPAGEAQYFLARIAFEQGDFAQAERQFRKYLDQHSVDDMMDCAALSGLAASLESLGNLEEAAKTYEQASTEYPSEPYSPQGLLEASRLYVKINQPNSAKKLYKTIIEKYPESGVTAVAKKELDQIK